MKNLFLIVAAFALSGTSCLGGEESEIKNYVIVGDNVPAFNASPPPTYYSASFKSPEYFDGRKSLLVLFDPTCGQCKIALRTIEQAWKDFLADNRDTYCLVNISRQRTDESAALWAAEEFTMPYYLDPDRTIFGRFANMTVPRIYLIGTGGKIEYMGVEQYDFTAAWLLEKLAALE